MSEARLHVSDSQGQRIVVLDRPLFVIGRRTSANLQLTSTDVSREHAEIVREDGRYTLRDRGSRFGTFVNGEQITERALQHGDRIRLGRTDAIQLVFDTDATKTSGFLDTSSSEGTNFKQMAALFDGLRALGSGRMLDEVLTVVMDSALEVTSAERGFMMLANADDQLELKIARGRGKTALPGTTFQVSQKIPREVFKTGTTQTVTNLGDQNIQGHDQTIAIGIRQVLCVPLRVTPMSEAGSEAGNQRVIGVLYLDGREKRSMLSEATTSSLEAFSTQAAIAIESARLYAESADKARTDRDLRIAAEIQRALLPEPVFDWTTCDLAAASIPCRTVGGDFYDFIDIGDRGLGFALGDVAGKGPAAALLAAAVQTTFSAQVLVDDNPAATLARVNKALLRRAIEARFATMFYGAVTSDGHLSYCNAGQEPPLVVRADANEWLEEGGPVLGLLTSASYAFATVRLEPGDLVVVCSDGVTEARNLADDEFGRDRLVDALKGLHGSKPDTALEQLLSAIKQFSRGAAQADDITALILRYRGSA